MGKVLFLDQAKCSGCRTCEAACSLVNFKIINRAKSRIHVYRTDVLKLTPLFCDQCEERPCLSACPQNAFTVEEGGVRLDEGKCDGCGVCAGVCTKIFFIPDSGRAIICTQCGACVPGCPEGALEIRST